MSTLNRVTTAVFDSILAPLGGLGAFWIVTMLGAVFVVPALLLFKQISWQGGIKGAKERIKGHLIAIRIYQNDLLIVATSVGRILVRNVQYLGLNFGPLLPLLPPFTLVVAQLATRYGFEPLPVETRATAELRSGQGTLLEVHFASGHEAEAAGLAIEWPAGLEPLTQLVRSPGGGVAYQEFLARAEGDWTITLRTAAGAHETKRVLVGSAPEGAFQPERVRSFWAAWLWPAEPTLAGSSPFERIAFAYPERPLPLSPGGPIGVMLIFFVSSLVAGVVVLKVFRIQI